MPALVISALFFAILMGAINLLSQIWPILVVGAAAFVIWCIWCVDASLELTTSAG